ncbi:MAG: carbohydrate-binding family 9-like protein [Firmicutes bacterium]|nr:carbohydrate-binding family 9-like protein [Bacillota bacterium]
MSKPLVYPRHYICYRVRKPLAIDGRLDDPAWADTAWTEEFVDIEGDVRPRPRFRTRAKMLWDDEYFYVGADMEEPHVWATLTKRDSIIYHDNDFEVFIDPDGDNHNYYELELNALNTVFDLRLETPYKDGGTALIDWDIAGLKTAVHVDGTLNNPYDVDRGWSVEIAIPWKALAEYAGCPCPPREGDQWRVNFSRVEWKVVIENGRYRKVPNTPEDNWVWSPQGVIDMHRPETWGYVQFSTAKPGRARFRPDETFPARMELTRLYYAQKEFYEKHRRWANDLRELGWTPRNLPGCEPIALTLTSEGYLATMRCRTGDGKQYTLHIQHDSRTWVE